MHPFQIVMIISVTALLLVAALFLIVLRMPSRPGIHWWLGAALLQMLAYLMGLMFFGAEKSASGDIIFYSLQMAVNLGLLIGTQLFTDNKISIASWLKAFCVVIVIVAGIRYAQEIFIAELGFALFNSACLLIAGVGLITQSAHYKNRLNLEKAIGICFIVIGLHWLDYPFLSGIDWFVPIGFFLGMAFAVTIFLLLAALALFQFRKQTKDSEQKAIHAAIHDPLTGLYNRGYLGRLFEKHVAASARSGHSFVVMYLDLDGFKQVNDNFGHKAGDLVLQIVSKRLKNWLGEKGDVLRLGGDEILVFAILRGECEKSNVQYLAESVLSLIEEPMVDNHNKYLVSSSIGVCCYPLHGDNLDQVVGQADDLMYQAKKSGKRTICYAELPELEKSNHSNPTDSRQSSRQSLSSKEQFTRQDSLPG